jgi:glycosyltransferase involved in cell wall biosynthesis
MKVAWVTPFCQRSAIGRVSSAITRALSENGHEVMIIRSERDRNDATPTHSTSLPVFWCHDTPVGDLELSTDVIVLNFGDNYDLHAGTIPYARSGTCLGIFHDFYIYNLFNRWVVQNGFDEQVHNDEIRFVYGESVTTLAKQAWSNDVAVEKIAETLPMTEWMARRCGAALAHSRFYVSRLIRSCPGPTAVAPLCFESRKVKPLPSRNEDVVTITTVGVINPNKCADAIIKSIASSSTLQSRCRFRLVGAISGAEALRLKALCGKVAFNNLDIVGEVDDGTLVRELERADIFACLRNPVLEGASASTIEGMKSGRPVLVANAGFYSDLPSDLVFKIPRTIDIPVLTEVLERLVSNEELRRETGARASDWAKRTFSVEKYVDVLEQLMEEFVRVRPLLDIGKRVGQQLAGIGATDDDPSIDLLAKKMQDLFGVSATNPSNTP